MNDYTPDKWTIIKIEGPDIPLTYKVFACWYGGFLGSNSWRMNSGIKYVTEEDNSYIFVGHSGSAYKCPKGCYGTHMHGSGILQSFIDRAKQNDVVIEILPEDTNWVDLSY